MHRTTTAATLLVTVAVSALSACVTVQRPATPAAPRDTARWVSAAPRPDGSTQPRLVQAPAQEALERTGPSRQPKHQAPPAPRDAPEAPPVVHHPPAVPAVPAAPPAPPRLREHPRRPHFPVRPVPPPVPKAPNVCALGRKYGGWRADSPEAQICEKTYGH